MKSRGTCHPTTLRLKSTGCRRRRRDFTPPLQLRARHNGNMYLVSQEGRFSFNITELADPVGYLLQAARESVEKVRAS